MTWINNCDDFSGYSSFYLKRRNYSRLFETGVPLSRAYGRELDGVMCISFYQFMFNFVSAPWLTDFGLVIDVTLTFAL